MTLRIVTGLLAAAALVSAARAEDPLSNHVLLRLAEPEARRAVERTLRLRLERFGLPAEVVRRGDADLLVRLPALEAGQEERVLRLLVSPGRLEVSSVAGGEAVVGPGEVRGIATTLENDRIRFRLLLADGARTRWEAAPDDLVLRWDGREVLYFRKEGRTPAMAFPAAYPKEDLRVLFCCVLHGPLPATPEVVESDLGAVDDPALAWRQLVAGRTEPDPRLEGTVEFRQRDRAARYVASTRIVERAGRRLYLLEDRLEVPGHPEQGLVTEVLCAPDFSLVEGKIRVGGQDVPLEPAETFLAPGVSLRIASLLPARPGRAYGPGGRLRVQDGPAPGTLEVVSPSRPARILLRGGEVVSLVLDEGGEPFLRGR